MPILNLEGGWEYWVQIDFPPWLDITYNVQFDYRREVTGVLPGGGRLDWLINSQGVGGVLTAIEIKAQTHRYLTAAFVADVRADVAKLQTLGAGYNRIMLAAVCDANAATILTQQDGFAPLVHFAGNAAAFLTKVI